MASPSAAVASAPLCRRRRHRPTLRAAGCARRLRSSRRWPRRLMLRRYLFLCRPRLRLILRRRPCPDRGRHDDVAAWARRRGRSHRRSRNPLPQRRPFQQRPPHRSRSPTSAYRTSFAYRRPPSSGSRCCGCVPRRARPPWSPQRRPHRLPIASRRAAVDAAPPMRRIRLVEVCAPGHRSAVHPVLRPCRLLRWLLRPNRLLASACVACRRDGRDAVCAPRPRLRPRRARHLPQGRIHPRIRWSSRWRPRLTMPSLSWPWAGGGGVQVSAAHSRHPSYPRRRRRTRHGRGSRWARTRPASIRSTPGPERPPTARSVRWQPQVRRPPSRRSLASG